MKHAYKRILYGAAGVVSRVTGLGSLSTPTLHLLTQGKVLRVTIITIHLYILAVVVCIETFVMGDMLP